MANTVKQSSTNYLPPRGEYDRFEDEAHYLEKVKEWGLSTKKEFMYKDRYQHTLVSIKGFEVFGETGEYNTIVIEFPDGNLTCIHPAYLKEMQSSNFGKELAVQDSPEASTVKKNVTKQATSPAASSPPKQPKTANKARKLTLPEDKVHFTATVKQFALSWNHFNEMNDEVIVFENVRIEQEDAIEVGLAWGSHSKTLKKQALEPGMKLEFDGKIVKKSLPKGKDVEDESMLLDVSIPYKINNPSKIAKK